MKQPKISIIIPIYNVEKYLNRCIDSVVNQSLKDIEIILVDDGSPDNCPQLCDEWAKKDSRIKVIHKKNAGLGMARNTGIQHATGEYIAFIDSDDYVDLDMYAKLLKKAELHNADIVYCGHQQGLKDGTYINKSDFDRETIFDDKESIEELSINYFYPTKGRIMTMSVWHSIYRRGIIKTEFYSEREVVSEDLHFQISAILNSGKIVYIPDCLYYYCHNGESLARTFKISKFYGYQKLIKLLLELYPHRKSYVYYFYFTFTINFIRFFYSNQAIDKKKKKQYLKQIYSDDIWKEVKTGTNISMYPKHLKIFYGLMNKHLFGLFYLFILFDYHVVYKK